MGSFHIRVLAITDLRETSEMLNKKRPSIMIPKGWKVIKLEDILAGSVVFCLYKFC